MSIVKTDIKKKKNHSLGSSKNFKHVMKLKDLGMGLLEVEGAG